MPNATEDAIATRLMDYVDDVVNVRDHPGTESNGTIFYVGRSVRGTGVYGNPWVLTGRSGIKHRQEVVIKFVRYVRDMQPERRKEWLKPLAEHLAAGGKLGCWCMPKLCHALVLAAWARAEFRELFTKP